MVNHHTKKINEKNRILWATTREIYKKNKSGLVKRNNLTEKCPAWEELNEQYHYLQGCIDTVVYLMTGKLPQDGNHDGMKDHKPVEGHVRRDLDALD